MSDETESVFSLITQLCEQFSKNKQKMKKLRSRSYEILLGKQETRDNTKLVKFEDTTTEVFHWHLILAQLGFSDHSTKLHQLAPKIRTAFSDEMLKFLLCMKEIPPSYDSDDSLDLNDDFKRTFNIPVGNKTSNISNILLNNRPETPNVWEAAARAEYNPRRTWEAYKCYEPQKERPFASEIGAMSADALVQSRLSVYEVASSLRPRPEKPKIVPIPDLIRHLKLILVGIASDMFPSQADGFALAPNVTISGVSPLTLQKALSDFGVCGVCYKTLNEMVNGPTLNGIQPKSGYIFTEFCRTIDRYLEYYRKYVFQQADDVGPLKFDRLTAKVREQIKILAAIVKVGAPKGVELLNELFRLVRRFVLNDKMLLVLYSILFPCYQVYFWRFLQRWLLDGELDDLFDEFFVKSSGRYAMVRGRAYWTRCFYVEETLVPEFLQGLDNDVLNCGKAMNLLKLSNKKNKLCMYLMGEKPLIISCCVVHQQLRLMQQNSMKYSLDIRSECGPRLDFRIKTQKDNDPYFVNLIARKRILFLEKSELERKKKLIKINRAKQEEFAALKEQYDAVLAQKQARIMAEVEDKMKMIAFNLEIAKTEDAILENEARILIDYYDELCAISDRRKKTIETRIQIANNTLLELDSSDESFYSADEPPDGEIPPEIEQKPLHSAESLDEINANAEIKPIVDNVAPKTSSTCLEAFEMARRNKAKVMTANLGIYSPEKAPHKMLDNLRTSALTDLERNRFRVLTSEFEIIAETTKKARFDNENAMNANRVLLVAEKTALSLNFPAIIEPMSVDSTPVSEMGRSDFSSVPTTAETQATDEGEPFFGDSAPESYVLRPKRSDLSVQSGVFSKTVDKNDITDLDPFDLKRLLRESILVPLQTQTEIINNELIKFFVLEMGYLEHLESLRDYFFLQDGEFGRNVSDKLFERLYEAKNPADLINGRTLQAIIADAVEFSNKKRENTNLLSFKINSIDGKFALSDLGVLDCLSLTYKVKWPLNVLLPSETIAKYDKIFNFLLKLRRVAWVLNKTCLDLKLVAKMSGKKEIYLMASPQFRRMHQTRHVMLHFVQNVQNYIAGEVLQTTFADFEQKLTEVDNIEDLYVAHTTYIKNILFLCLLQHKSAALRNAVEKILRLILKFYELLRTGEWAIEDGVFVHSKFAKIESVFHYYETHLAAFMKMAWKVANSEFQPQMAQLLEVLDINGFYSKGQNVFC